MGLVVKFKGSSHLRELPFCKEEKWAENLEFLFLGKGRVVFQGQKQASQEK
jgi:hypothetical protein